MYDVAKFAYEKKKRGIDRGIDRETKKIIEEKFGKNAVDSCY